MNIKVSHVQKYVVLGFYNASFVNSKVAFVNLVIVCQVVTNRFTPLKPPHYMSSYHNIRVRQVNKEKIKLLAKRSGKSETDYANRMILYVYNSGLDIYTDIAPNVPDLIKNLDNRIVSFLKKREKDFFVPMNKAFREMVKLHNQTLETLDILHPGEIGFSSGSKTNIETSASPSFKIPEKKPLDSPESVKLYEHENNEKQESEKDRKNTTISEEEREGFLLKIERLEKEKSTFEKELKFLIKNLVPNKSISGPKFTCNLPQKEIDRIKYLVDGD